MARRRALSAHLAKLRPDIDDPSAVIASGRVIVDGRIVTNPGSLVDPASSVTVRSADQLRGTAKLEAALRAFTVAVSGRIALDVGASAGGFTRALLDAGARRVYAVDAGHGQLLGSLRTHERVVNLEATNVADLDETLIPDRIDVVTIDVSYLSLAAAVSQLDRIAVSPGADLIGLVKPMFELRLANAPTAGELVTQAAETAIAGVEAAGWRVMRWIPSPVTGARGAAEALLHATRRPVP